MEGKLEHRKDNWNTAGKIGTLGKLELWKENWLKVIIFITLEGKLENGNLKKFSKKFLQIAKISPFSLQLLVVIGHTNRFGIRHSKLMYNHI